jgi:hypothetical protein
MVHAWADTLITPINDSFVDLDVLAVVDTEAQEILGRGYYAKMVLEARKQKASRTGGVIDWIVLRNRLSNLQARNKRCMADTLEKLSTDLDFRNGPGLSDRVVYRELFRSGLTLLDLREDGAGVAFSMSHVAARQELRALVAAIKPLPAAQADCADQESRLKSRVKIAIEQLTQYQPAEDRPEDGQPADNKTVAAAPFAGDSANSEEAGEQSLETGGGVDGEKGGGQGKNGVRYIVRDRELETRIYKIAAIQAARIRNEPHAEKLKVFANLEEAKAAAGAILSRIIYEKEEKGRSTYLIKARRANLMYETDTKVTNYFV